MNQPSHWFASGPGIPGMKSPSDMTISEIIATKSLLIDKMLAITLVYFSYNFVEDLKILADLGSELEKRLDKVEGQTA